MSEIVRREMIPLLTVLGKYDWVSFKPHPTEPSTTFSWNFPDDTEILPHEHMLRVLKGEIRRSASRAKSYYSFSKALAGGPKLLCPTREQCEALENTDVNVAFADYRQPYPVVIIELPKDFRDELSRRFGHPCKTYLVCHHDERSGYIIVALAPANDYQYCLHLSPRSEYATIEDAFRRDPAGNKGVDFDLAKVVQRLAVNFCLMMTFSGAADRGVSNPKAYQKQQRNAKSRNRKKADRAKNFLAEMFNLIEFDQQVKFYDEQTEREQDLGEAEDASMSKKPHWRRGHFRRQRFGQEWSQSKLIFVKPVMVNRRFFSGSDADTKTTYVSANRFRADSEHSSATPTQATKRTSNQTEEE